jgi:threonine/homoserine/homoserine lactone efflux protein
MTNLPEATLLAIFGTSFVVALTGALMPGPLLAVTIGEVTRRGFWAGPLLILGHGILELATVLALILGLGRLVEDNQSAGNVISIIGGLILVAMGAATVINSRRQKGMSLSAQGSKGRNGMLILSGMVISLSNPFWFIWWAGIGLSYLVWSLKLGAAGVAAFFSGHFLADFGWYTLISFVIVSGKKVIKDSVYQWLLFACGIVLVGIGIYFLTMGTRYFAG